MGYNGVEELKASRLKIAGRWVRTGLSVAVLAGAVSYPALVHAQNQQNFNGQQTSPQQGNAQAIDQIDTGNGSGARLPSGFAAQQLPPTFGMDEASEGASAQGSDQIIPSPDKQAAAVQKSASSEVESNPENVPAQPETRRLVPATAMGGAAQSARQTQGSGNSVEDVAEAAEAQYRQQAQSAPREPSADLPQSVLESYGAGNQSGDDLPQVDGTTMSALNGEFDGMGTMPQSQRAPAEMTPEEKRVLQEDIRREAFDAAITGMFPLTPQQIRALVGKYDETQRAVNEPIGNPRPEITVTNISLDPGVMPPTLKTAVGNVTTMNVLDATGAPWPVQDVTWAGDFEIVQPEEGGHIIRITPMSQFARGNMVVRLLTLKTPVTLTLETNRDVVQYRVDARIPEYGPFANAPLMRGGKSMVAGDSNLMSLLDGVAPTGFVRMEVSGVDGRTTAYNNSGITYVRTPLTLLSPAWQSSVSSADGMNVYALNSAPVLLLSDEGQFLRASLKDKEELLDE